jgi:hypothetical protein
MEEVRTGKRVSDDRRNHAKVAKYLKDSDELRRAVMMRGELRIGQYIVNALHGNAKILRATFSIYPMRS